MLVLTDLQGHRVQRDPLDSLDAGEDQGPTSGDEARFASLIKDNPNYYDLTFEQTLCGCAGLLT